MSKYKCKLSQPGFTMIELLVVIVILGLLSTIGLGSFRSSQAKSRDVRRKAELGQIARALEMYYNDHKEYPAATDLPSSGGIFTDSNTNYMLKFPQDPGVGKYGYYQIDSGKGYALMARLENNKDRDVPTTVDGDTAVYSGGACGAATCDCLSGGCNYAISSTNISLSDEFIFVADN